MRLLDWGVSGWRVFDWECHWTELDWGGGGSVEGVGLGGVRVEGVGLWGVSGGSWTGGGGGGGSEGSWTGGV